MVPVYLPGHYQLAQPSFWLLVVIPSAFDWMGITYYVRGEFTREGEGDYVGAAMTAGVSDAGIIFGHILPNALTPVVSFAPFVIVANTRLARGTPTSSASVASADAQLGAS